jgi:hypothetical protein
MRFLLFISGILNLYRSGGAFDPNDKKKTVFIGSHLNSTEFLLKIAVLSDKILNGFETEEGNKLVYSYSHSV